MSQKAAAANVLYLIDSLAYGGAELQLLELIRNLDPARYRPHLCTLKDSSALFEELDIPKLCLHFNSFTDRSMLRVLTNLSRFIREHNIRIIQTFFQDPFLLAAMVRPFHRVKLVGTFLDLGFWRTPLESRKMQTAYPLFAGFVANSQAVKDHFVAVDGIAPERITVIYNGFNLDAVPAPRPVQEGKAPLVGIVANLNRPVKRVQDFVAAAAAVRRELPEARFLVVGDGHLRGELEAQAASLGLGGSISFTGRISNPLEVVCDWDIGVLTSESEGFSNAVIEYMACGVPVVVTNVGGNPELVAQGENGYLVPVGAPEQLSARIVQILKDPAHRSSMAMRNRRKIIDEYSMPVMIERQSGYYDGLLLGS